MSGKKNIRPGRRLPSRALLRAHDHERRLQVLFDTMDEGVVLITPRGTVLQANAVAERIVGLNRTLMERHSYFGPKWKVLRTDGTPMPLSERPATRAMKEKRLIKDVVMGFEQRDGSICWVNVSATPLVNTKDRVDGIVITFDDITVRKLAEQKLAEQQEQLQTLTADLVVAEETERRRIAAGLHDEINQMIVAARMKLRELASCGDGADTSSITREIDDTLHTVLQTSRSLVFDLVSPVLQKMGLSAAVADLCERMEKQHGISFVFEEHGRGQRLSNEAEILVFHSVRELLRNVVRHAEAYAVNVAIHKRKNEVRVVVDDDGKGFDDLAPGTALTPQGGFGLFAVGERLKHLRGTVCIERSIPKGSRVTMVVPRSSERTKE